MNGDFEHDEDLLTRLQQVDEGPAEVTSWEAAFMDEILYKQRMPMTAGQRKKAWEIVKKYEDHE